MKHFLIYFFVLISLIFPVGATSLNSIFKEMQDTIAHAEAGSTDWQKTSFGRVRLLSCQSGLTDGQSVLFGMEADIDPDYTLALPRFQVSTGFDDGVQVFTPFQSGTNKQSWVDGYQGMVFFPMRLTGTSSVDERPVSVTADIRSCTGVTCQTETITQTLVLDGTHNHKTTWCGRIRYALSSSAVSADETLLSGQIFQDETELQARFIFARAPETVQIQTDPPLKELTHQMTDNAVTILLYPIHPIQIGDMIHFRIKSNIGYYVVDIPVGKEPLAPISPKFPWIWAVFGGLLFFIMTPLWSLWWEPKTKTVPAMQKTTKQTIRSLFPFVWISCFLTFSGAIGILFDKTYMVWVLIPIVGLYLYRPTYSILWSAMGLLILPKPFMNTLPISDAFIISSMWTIIALSPFLLKIKTNEKFLLFLRRCQSESIMAYQIFRRLPFIILAGWSIGILLCQRQSIPLEDPIALSPEQPTLVSFEKPLCLRCLWEQKGILGSSMAKKMMTAYGIRHVRWSMSSLSDEWMNRYRSSQANHSLILPDGRVYTLPQGLTIHQFSQFLTNTYGDL